MMRNSLLAAIAALLLVPAAAPAAQVTFGSNLSGTPDVLHDNNKADTLFFNYSARNSHRVPVSGQILAIRIKGRIVPRSPDVDKGHNLWHSQVLRPNGNGTYRVDSSSQHFWFPIGGSPDAVTTWVPSVQCVRAGDYVDFNHIGGWNGDPAEPGTRYQIFKRDPTSEMHWYERDQGTNIGATVFSNEQRDTAGNRTSTNGWAPRPRAEELMMQVVVGTRFDSNRACEGGLQGYEYKGVDVQRQRFTVNDDGIAGARVTCGSGRGFCEGTVRLEHEGVVLGSAPFTLNRSLTTNVDIPLTSEGARLVNRRKQVDATVIADTSDDIGQRATTRGVSMLKAARPGGGFPGTQLRKQAAKAKGTGFTIRATCPRASYEACTGKFVVRSQQRIGGRMVTFGSAKYSIPSGKVMRVPVKLTGKGKKALRRARRAVAIVTTTSRDASGGRKKERSKITLKG